MAKTKSMQRSLEVIKKQGLTYQIVEKWNPWSKKREDLFGIIDILVLDGVILGVQATGADVAGHRRKLADDNKSMTIAWLEAGGLLELWSWRNLVIKRGMKAKKWNLKITEVLIVAGEIYFEEVKDGHSG